MLLLFSVASYEFIKTSGLLSSRLTTIYEIILDANADLK